MEQVRINIRFEISSFPICHEFDRLYCLASILKATLESSRVLFAVATHGQIVVSVDR